MKNTPKPYRLFLDTSVLLSGLNSPLGASGFILALFKLNQVSIAVSHEIILEAEGVIKRKFPLLADSLSNFLASKPRITKKLTSRELYSAYKIIDSEDAPILAGAIKSKAEFLITLDKKFQKLTMDKVGIKVVLPGEFLKIFNA